MKKYNTRHSFLGAKKKIFVLGLVCMSGCFHYWQNNSNQQNMTNQRLEEKFEALLSGDIEHWGGLPNISIKDLDLFLEKTGVPQETTLGAYPAVLYNYYDKKSTRALNVYVRNELVVMIVVTPMPGNNLLSILPKPDAILSQEIYIENAYAFEYLYCKQGLLLTVTQDLREKTSVEVVRFRVIQPIQSPQELNAALYFPLDAREKW